MHEILKVLGVYHTITATRGPKIALVIIYAPVLSPQHWPAKPIPATTILNFLNPNPKTLKNPEIINPETIKLQSGFQGFPTWYLFRI